MAFYVKSDEKANGFRQLGNFQYNEKEYMNALILYNKSITYACSKKVLSLGYANRSAVYFEIERYEECLKNIELARENSYPKDKISKLDEREEKCMKLMENGTEPEDPWNFFKLSHPANEKIPWIADCLEMRTTQKYGRGIYATKDLKAGDIISIEELKMHFLKDDAYYKHCNNCFKTAMMNLIPCTRTASMMFCSNDCMKNFYSNSGEIEVTLKNDMKMLSKVASSFGVYKKFDDFINKTDLKELKKTIFDFDLSNPCDPEYNQNLMTCLLSLTSKENNFMNDSSCSINNYVSKKAADHILGLVPLNNFVCAYGSGGYKLPCHDGSNIPLFRSLINHACVSNVNFIYIDNKEVTLVLKPIKAGEQLMYCYHDKHAPYHELNKKRMMETHNFICDCQECIDKSHQFKISLKAFPVTFMSRKNFEKGKKYLAEGWNIINDNSQSREIIDDSRLRNLQILYALAYYATFPC